MHPAQPHPTAPPCLESPSSLAPTWPGGLPGIVLDRSLFLTPAPSQSSALPSKGLWNGLLLTTLTADLPVPPPCTLDGNPPPPQAPGLQTCPSHTPPGRWKDLCEGRCLSKGNPFGGSRCPQEEESSWFARPCPTPSHTCSPLLPAQHSPPPPCDPKSPLPLYCHPHAKPRGCASWGCLVNAH